MSTLRKIAIAACAALLAGPVLADPAAGVWKTEADGKGQTALVVSQPCGNALCGTITEVMNSNGETIAHRNVGRRIFWDVQPVSPGVYEGRAFVPAFGAEYAAKMTLSGDTMQVGGCFGPICKSQTWIRVK